MSTSSPSAAPNPSPLAKAKSFFGSLDTPTALLGLGLLAFVSLCVGLAFLV